MEDSPSPYIDVSTSTLGERVFFAAKEGMSLTLYVLLYELNTNEKIALLNTVSAKFHH